MPELRGIKDLLFTQKKEAAGQGNKKFLPEGSLDQILCRENISVCLRDPSFQIQQHKFESTVDLVFEGRKKVLAILVETRLERTIHKFIEHGISDSVLPASEEQLKPILAEPTDRQLFTERQWDYLAHEFSRGPYVQQLSADYVLPYVEQTKIGSGGFSRVYKVLVHPAHQHIEPKVRGTGLYLVRKEIDRVNSKSKPEHELELLFLLKHPNIIRLLTAYVQNGIYNLLFPPADMDLNNFLLREDRVSGFEEDRTILKAIHGLSSGLKHLHYCEQKDSPNTGTSNLWLGTHQDIKPQNVLVSGNNFLLADFGLSRLKPVEEGSQTIWKDATYPYSAPECRDESTWIQGQIGRASDIWSLSCIISELMIYTRNGFEGVQNFRVGRSTQLSHGKQDAFHDGKCVKEKVLDALREVERDTNSLAISALFSLLVEMFTERPKDRPNAKQVESRLEGIALQRLIQDMLDAMTELQNSPDIHGCQESLRMESIRFRAWAGAFGFISLRQQIINPIPQIPASFIDLCDTLENAIKSLESLHISEAKEKSGNYGLTVIRQCNNTIYDLLPKTWRARADGLVPILFTVDASLQSLLTVSQAAVPGYEDTSRIAAIKYMSSLSSQHSGDFGSSTKIKHSQIEKDMRPNNFDAYPEIYWYSTECPQDQRQRILVEWRDYGRNLDDEMENEESRRRAVVIFRRIQGLVALLQKPQPSNLRVLDCLGAFEDPEEPRFGIVHRFPDKSPIPFRLHYLLKGGGSKGLRPPHIGQKITLAKTVAACLQDVHLSGWVHKNLSSYNILFFTSANQLTEENYRMPYLVGFQYSREDETGAYTSGPDNSREAREYQHPYYREGREGFMSFKREFDYYSLGLVLLEIGVWESLSSVYKRQLTSSPSQLRKEYIRYCEKYLLERMGPIYSEVTMKCLGAESHFSGKEADAAIAFQNLVIDELESCKV